MPKTLILDTIPSDFDFNHPYLSISQVEDSVIWEISGILSDYWYNGEKEVLLNRKEYIELSWMLSTWNNFIDNRLREEMSRQEEAFLNVPNYSYLPEDEWFYDDLLEQKVGWEDRLSIDDLMTVVSKRVMFEN